MQADFTYLWKQLVGEVAELPPGAAQRMVSNAWLRVQNEREWSWRHKEGLVIFPQRLATGTISLTKNSLTGTLDATALAAWNADTQLPMLGQRQLRFSGAPNRIFNITNFDSGTGVVTFDSLYTGSTNATSSYSLYSAYNVFLDRTGTTESNFTRLISMRSLITGQLLFGSEAQISPLDLNRMDRGRVSYGFPYYFAFNRYQDIGTYPTLQRLSWYEFWPHCTSEQSYETLYITRPRGFEEDPTQILPATVNPELVLQAAREKVYDWADNNRGSIKALQGTNWGLKKAQLMNKFSPGGDSYYAMLREHSKIDDDYINNTILPRHGITSAAYSLAPVTTLIQVSS